MIPHPHIKFHSQAMRKSLNPYYNNSNNSINKPLMMTTFILWCLSVIILIFLFLIYRKILYFHVKWHFHALISKDSISTVTYFSCIFHFPCNPAEGFSLFVLTCLLLTCLSTLNDFVTTRQLAKNLCFTSEVIQSHVNVYRKLCIQVAFETFSVLNFLVL